MEQILKIVMRLETKIDQQAKRIIRLNKKVASLERRLTPIRGRPSKITSPPPSPKSEIAHNLKPIVKGSGAPLLEKDEIRLFEHVKNKNFAKLSGYARRDGKLVSENRCVGFGEFFRYWFKNPQNHTVYRNTSRFYLYVSPKNWANVSQAEFYNKLKEASWRQYMAFLVENFPQHEDELYLIEHKLGIPLKNHVFDSVIGEYSDMLKYAYQFK